MIWRWYLCLETCKLLPLTTSRHRSITIRPSGLCLQRLQVVILFISRNFFKFHDWFDFTSFFVALPISAPSSTPQANIMVHLTKFRENHLEYSSELARYSNEVTTTYKETPRTDHENKALTDLALRGLHLLSDWTSVVTELYRWFHGEITNPLIFLKVVLKLAKS